MFKIEKVKREDARTVLELRRDAILSQCRGYYPIEVLEGWTDLELSIEFSSLVERNCYLARCGDHVVGSGMINIETGKIDAVFIHPDHMRKGIGKSIISFLEGIALDHELKMLTLQSTLNAAEFYRACEFVGNEVEMYTTQKKISFACIPMRKVIVPRSAPVDADK